MPLSLSGPLALAALVSPPQECPPKPADVEHLQSLRRTIQAIAIQHFQIMDAREYRFLLTRPEDFPADLHLLQRRFQDLSDAPPLSDCMKFPDRALVNDLLSFNRTYKAFLEDGASIDTRHSWERSEVLREIDRLYVIWDLVRDSRCDYYYVTVRRQSLKKLKEAIGEEAYSSGTLPPHVPIWRFHQQN